MDNTILFYQNQSKDKLFIENIRSIADSIVRTNQAKCCCVYSYSEEDGIIRKHCCRKNPSGLEKIMERFFIKENGNCKSVEIKRNEFNKQNFCPNIESAIVILKQYYNQRLAIVFGYNEKKQIHADRIIAHYDSFFDYVIKSHYYDDVNCHNQLDLWNLIMIVDLYGNILFVNPKIRQALNIHNNIENMNITDVLYQNDEKWLNRMLEILAFKPYTFCDIPFKGINGAVSMRKKVCKGVWNNESVIFLTSDQINAFEPIPLAENNKPAKIKHVAKPETKPTKIKLRLIDGFKMVNFIDIVYCKLTSSYIDVFLTDNSTINLTNRNKKISKYLLSGDFFQIHKSYVVNIFHVQQYNSDENKTVRLSNNVVLPVSIRRSADFEKEVNKKFLLNV